MKICVAQTRPFKGNIRQNIKMHQRLTSMALSAGAAIIVFPELSLTGYEPALAAQLALNAEDSCLQDFQTTSNAGKITICVGLPTKNEAGTCISMAIFQPGQPVRCYSKKYLHADEYPFFTEGKNFPFLAVQQTDIALGICYEISVPEHIQSAISSGASLYMASVAKSVKGVENAYETLAGIAAKYSIPVLMSNCIGHCDDFESGGKTAAWNNNGRLAGQLNDTSEGILIYDTANSEVVIQTV